MTICNFINSWFIHTQYTSPSCFHERSCMVSIDRKSAGDYNCESQSLPALRYLVFCNVLLICNVRAIPTYRVYQLYDYRFVTS